MHFNKNKAIYLQIVDKICEEILAASAQAMKLPSVRELAVQCQVNPNTALRAFAQLEEYGIITLQRGIGYFATETAAEKIRNYKRQEFIAQDLPQLLQTMKLLDLEFDELARLASELSE